MIVTARRKGYVPKKKLFVRQPTWRLLRLPRLQVFVVPNKLHDAGGGWRGGCPRSPLLLPNLNQPQVLRGDVQQRHLVPLKRHLVCDALLYRGGGTHGSRPGGDNRP